MNRKGFTLIELLSVIVLLAIIATISIYSVSSSIRASREEKASINNKSIIKACELYAKENQVEDKTEVSVSTLVSEGYLEKADSNDKYAISLSDGVYSCEKK